MLLLYLHRGCENSFETKLKTLASEILDVDCDLHFNLTIRREFALTDSLELIELASEKQLFQPLKVDFLGETSVDDGGPRRELASLIVMQCQDSYLMEGNFWLITCLSLYV